jgi:hypothetical protein
MPPVAPDMVTALPTPGMTIAQARRALAVAFRQAGLDSPELDARCWPAMR